MPGVSPAKFLNTIIASTFLPFSMRNTGLSSRKEYIPAAKRLGILQVKRYTRHDCQLRSRPNSRVNRIRSFYKKKGLIYPTHIKGRLYLKLFKGVRDSSWPKRFTQWANFLVRFEDPGHKGHA